MTRVTLLSFLHVTGLTREAFDSLLYVVIPPGHTMRRRRRGRPWSLLPDGMLGLLLCYLGSQMTMKWLCLILGITPTSCSCILKKILRMTVKRLCFHPLACIKFPDEQKMQQFAEMISIREPTISNVIGFMDGLGLATEMTDERIQQNACYCRYDCHSHHPGHLLPPPLCLHPPPRHHHHHYHSQHHRTKYYLPQLPRERCRHRRESGRTRHLNASKDTVGQGTGLTCRLMHAVAELPVPFVSKVLPPTKSRLHRLSLIRNSDLPPSLQVLGEIQLDNTDEDVVSVIGSANRTSGATSPCLVIGVHAQK